MKDISRSLGGVLWARSVRALLLILALVLAPVFAVHADDDILRGRTLKVGHLGPIRTLDPAKALDPLTKTVLACVLDGLYEYAPTGEIYPRIAASLPIQKEELLWLIPIRTGIPFHNGLELSAEDVAFSIQRLIREKKSLRKGDLFDFIAKARAEYGNIVELHLTRPVPNLLEYLTRIEFYPISKQEYLLAGKNFGSVGIIGTGPWQIAGFVPKATCELFPNNRYWLTEERLKSWLDPEYELAADEDEAKKKALPTPTPEGPTISFGEETPAPQKLSYEPWSPEMFTDLDSLFAPSVPAIDEFETKLPRMGGINFQQYAGPLGLNEAFSRYRATFAMGLEIPSLYELSRSRLKIDSAPGTQLFQVYMNTEHPKLEDANIRKALALVFDRRLLISSVFEGFARPATGPLPPDLFNAVDIPGYQGENRELAARLLAEAGYSKDKPLTLTLHYTRDLFFQEIAFHLERQTRTLPLTLVTIPVSKKELLNRMYAKSGFDAYDYELALEDWQDYRGGTWPEQFLVDLYHSESEKNKVRLRDPEIDELLECLPLQGAEEDYGAAIRDVTERIQLRWSTIYLCFADVIWGKTSQPRAEYYVPQGWLHLKDGWTY